MKSALTKTIISLSLGTIASLCNVANVQGNSRDTIGINNQAAIAPIVL